MVRDRRTPPSPGASARTTAIVESRQAGKIFETRQGLPHLALAAHALHKSYGRLEVLRGVELEVRTGEIVAVVGPSGAGKSTLLHLVGLMEHPSAGDLTLLGWETAALDEPKKDELRNRYIGFLFQFHYLLPDLTLRENTALPLRIAGLSKRESFDRADEILNAVGLKERADHIPSRVSGGEQQRAALARAMVHKPALLLCDEPTGNLDLERGEEVRDLLWRVARAQHATVLIVTHNPEIAASADRTIRLVDGKIVQA